MTQKSQHTFIGLDTDTADRFLKEGSFRDSLNIHIGSSEGEGMFSVENIKGNSFINYSLPSGTNQVIGSCEDITNKCIYYFLYNTVSINIQSTNGTTITTSSNHGLVQTDLITIAGVSGRSNILGDWIVLPINNNSFTVQDPPTYLYSHHTAAANATGTSGATGTVIKHSHSIIKYNGITNTITLIYKHSRLNFNKDYPITGTALLNNVLHWTDNYNPPRSLDLSQVSLYDTFFIDKDLDFIKTPPTTPATVIGQWVNSAGTVVPYLTNKKEPNNMADKTYQFIYRYVYPDNTKSVWGPLSEAIGTGYADSKINKIIITIPSAIGFIKAIELAFRDDILNNFNFIGRVSSGVVNFLNDIAYSIVDSAETSKYFDSVPNICGALSTIQNRVFLGDCKEGFDVTINSFSAINILAAGGLVDHNQIIWKSDDPYEVGIIFKDRAGRRSGVYSLFKQVMFEGWKAMAFTLQGQPPVWAVSYNIVRSANLAKTYFVQGYYVVIKRDLSNNSTSVLFNSINGPLSYNAQDGDLFSIVGDTEKETYKIIEISSDKFGNSTIVIRGIIPEFNNGDIVGNFNPTLAEIYTPLKNRSLLYYETPKTFNVQNPGTDQRSFEPGQTRLQDYVSGDVYYRNLNDCIMYHARMVMHIEALDKSLPLGDKLTIKFANGYEFSVNRTTWEGTDFTEQTAAEAFVNVINQSRYYRAFMLFSGSVDINNLENGAPAGIVAPIARFVIYDNRKGINGDLTLTSATNYIVPVNRKSGISMVANSRVGPNGAQNFMDNNAIYAMSSNDKDLSWQSNIGQAGIVLVDGDKEVRRGTLIRFGGKFLTDTSINFVNSFDFTDSEPLSNAGNIRKLIAASNNSAEGSILLAIQEEDISSCYIGQVIIKTAAGGEQVATTDKVIGTANSLQKAVGTINPESVVQYNGLVYGFDALKGVVWRYGQDGLNFISDQGMRRFFYERSVYLLPLGSFKCYGGIDPYHNEYILTIPNTDSEKKTIAWSETLNRWTSFMSYAGEWYQKVNTFMVSFVNGQLWLHRSNILANNYYGIQYKSKLKMICNQEPDITKILHIVEEKSTSVWDCTEITTPEGQNSELLGLFDINNPNTYPQDFREYDNTTFVGVVMRDKNTPNMQSSDYPLLNGDLIRSDIFSIKMENSKTTKENLYFVNLMYIPSYKKA